MRKHAKYLALICFITTVFFACNKEEDPEPIDIVKANLLGEWEIASFTLNGQNRTAELADYTYEIYFNGDFTVNKGAIESYGSYDVNATAKTFTVNLTNPKPPGDAIDGAWQVYENTETSLWLKSFEQADGKEFRLTKAD